MPHLHPCSQARLPTEGASVTPPRFEVYTARDLEGIPQLQRLPAETRFAMRVVAHVLPFRVNRYVVDELIDWSAVPHDPIFQLTFPQPGMLPPEDFELISHALKSRWDGGALTALAQEIRGRLNPHPGGQRELNVPALDGEPLQGLQHKYRETVLFFPSRGQTCHTYCSYCFRWAQFVQSGTLQISARDARGLHRYLAEHPEVSDLLVTGGDPLVMRSDHLREYLSPLLDRRLRHVKNVRIGTKALSFWPHRFLTDPDADALLRLLEDLRRAGRHVAIMAHVSHWHELEPLATQRAVHRLLATGAVIRTQSPIAAHINDDPQVWAQMWRMQVRLGMVPYYMFVERDTGASRYFEVPLARACSIFGDAMSAVSGLGRTARGPCMSATPGKVEIQGITEIHGERVFVLRFLQGRNPEWLQRPFFARFDPTATWLDQLQPAFDEPSFFFERGVFAKTTTSRTDASTGHA